MEQRVEAFLHYMSAERGLSKNTIDAYRNDLTRFAEFAKERGGDGALGDVMTRELITNYIFWLRDPGRGAGYKAATVARKVAAVKSFCTFLLDHGDLTSNPTASVDSPRAPRSFPKPMTRDDVSTLIHATMGQTSPEAIRDAAMLVLMYGTGMRVTELVSLDIESLYLGSPAHVRCRGKGDKERVIPVGDRAVVLAVERYLDDARPILLRDRPQTALFVNRRGERLTRQGFWLILRNRAKDAGIGGHVTPHTLRHSFATHMLQDGFSIRDVQERLGHANVSTTQVYTQLTDTHLHDVYETAHPRAH